MPVGNGDERDGRVALRLVARQNVVALSFLLCNRAVLSLADVYPCDFAAGVLRAYVSSLGACNVLKTEDIHPPKTGISVHFSGSLV